MDGQLEILERGCFSQSYIRVLAPCYSRLHSSLLSSDTLGPTLKLQSDRFLQEVHAQHE
jgi:hypothetical protein